MKKLLYVLAAAILLTGCATSKVENTKETNNKAVTNAPLKYDDLLPKDKQLFMFTFDDKMYVALEGLGPSFALETYTDNIRYSEFDSSIVYIMDNKDTYQISVADMTYVPDSEKGETKQEILEAYYKWEKEYQEETGKVVFHDEAKQFVQYKDIWYLGWSYDNPPSQEQNSFVKTRGWTSIWGNYFVTIMESITADQNTKDREQEYSQLYKKLYVFDTPINEESVNRVLDPEYIPYDFSQSGDMTLDMYWEQYELTGNTQYLDRIMNYIESDDYLLQELNRNYDILSANEYTNNILLNSLEFSSDGQSYFLETFDSECYLAILLTTFNDGTENDARYIYSLLPLDFIYRSANKLTAFWRISTSCDEDPVIKQYVQSNLSNWSEKTQTLMKMMAELD